MIFNIIFRYPSDGGWEYHVASSISEWIVSTIFCFYILTFTDEFRSMTIEHPEILFFHVTEYSEIDRNIEESA